MIDPNTVALILLAAKSRSAASFCWSCVIVKPMPSIACVMIMQRANAVCYACLDLIHQPPAALMLRTYSIIVGRTRHSH